MANLKDFATGTVLTAPTPATSGPSVTLQSGEGARFPVAPFYAVAHPDYQLPTLDNAEKILVTAKVGDTFTITRAQGDTTAKSIAVGWRISNAVFAADLFTGSQVTAETPGGSVNGSNTAFTVTTAFTSGSLRVFLNGQRLKRGASDDYTENASLTGFTMNYAPASGDVLLVDYMVGSSVYMAGVNSFINSETPTGNVDGSNTAYTTARPYVSGTLQVYVNGLLQATTTHVTETSPSAGTFSLDTAPQTGDIVRVSYQYSTSAGGNADTLDGANASATPSAGFIPITDSNNMLVANIYRNFIINGSCAVGQRAAPNLSTTSQYGKTDRFRCHATGTAVSAGTINQSVASPVGRTGNALHLSGITITGTGIIFVRHRIEAKDALDFKNQVASFGVNVYHDVGSSINYTVTIRKATAADNFASTTDIQASSAQAVANTTGTRVVLQNVSMGDCSNGIEIEVKIECGAVTTKNFYLTEFQFNRGAVAMSFQPPTFAEDLEQCMRYYEKSYNYATAPGTGSLLTAGQSISAASQPGLLMGTANSSGGRVWGRMEFHVRKRVAPTMAYWDMNGNASAMTVFDANAGSAAHNNTADAFRSITGYERSCLATNSAASQWYAACMWTADAEL